MLTKKMIADPDHPPISIKEKPDREDPPTPSTSPRGHPRDCPNTLLRISKTDKLSRTISLGAELSTEFEVSQVKMLETFMSTHLKGKEVNLPAVP